jgi:hypothetical protein
VEKKAMDLLALIAGALVAGAVEAAKPTAAQAVKDAYTAVKAALTRKFGAQSGVVKAVQAVEEKPSSEGRARALEEELQDVRDQLDAEIEQLAKKLDEALKQFAPGTTYTATLTGSGAIAQGSGARAVGAGGVMVEGGSTGTINTGTQVTNIYGSAAASGAGGQRKPESPLAQKLYEALSGYAFNTDDLQDLMFTLHVDWDSLSGDNKGAKARAIVDYFAREGRLEELYRTAKEKRPRYAW